MPAKLNRDTAKVVKANLTVSLSVAVVTWIRQYSVDNDVTVSDAVDLALMEFMQRETPGR